MRDHEAARHRLNAPASLSTLLPHRAVAAGVSSCFLGSAQPDPCVETEALAGRYSLIYICPESALRLAEPLARLHARVGVSLVAVDEERESER